MREIASAIGAVVAFAALGWLIVDQQILDGEYFWQLVLVLIAVGGVYNAARG
jgi:hypothetical protein